MVRDIKEGNQCIFMFFTGFNFLVFLSSLGMLACAIYMFIVLDPDNFINFYMLGVSLTLLMMTLCSFKLRKSIHLLGCYIVIKVVLFTAVLVASLILIFNKTAVESWAKDIIQNGAQQNPEKVAEITKKLEENINSVGYAMLIFSFIMGASALTGWCYRNSTLEKTFKRREKLLAQREI